MIEMYVLDIALLRGREEEALSRLTDQRREAALRCRAEGARLLSVAAGLLLRRYVGEGPFLYGPRGKPWLPEGPGFNLSHSGRFALLARGEGSVGADIEPLQPPRPALTARVFTPAEQRWLSEEENRRFAFLWTRKEAALKWAGLGVGYPLRELSVLPGERPVLDGERCELYSAEYEGYWISAAGRDCGFVPRAVTWEEVAT